jgi:hypothetical protein
MAENGNNTLSYRVGELEKAVDKIGSKMEKIMDNELVHIRDEFSDVNLEVVKAATRINVLSVLNAGAIVVGVLLSRIL